MNEQIKKLAEQAGAVFVNSNGLNDCPQDSLVGDEIQKFAELIVRECADRVSKMVMRDKFDFIPQDPHSQGWNDAVEYASKELKKSLGVE